MKKIHSRPILVFVFCLSSLFSLAQDPETKEPNPNHRIAHRSGRSHTTTQKLTENEMLVADLARKEKANKEQELIEKAKKEEVENYAKELEERKNLKTKEDVVKFEKKKSKTKKQKTSP